MKPRIRKGVVELDWKTPINETVEALNKLLKRHGVQIVEAEPGEWLDSYYYRVVSLKR